MIKLIGLLFIITLIIWASEEPNKSSVVDNIGYSTIYPEQGRPVHHYNYDSSKYVYQDQVAPEPQRILTEPTVYPDLWVSDINGLQSSRDIDQVHIYPKGEARKRYRVRERENRTIDFVEESQ